MKTILKTCLGCFVFVILIGILLFVFRTQIISTAVNMLGFNKPKDLGIVYTAEDLKKMDSELGIEVEKITEETSISDSLVTSGKKEVDASFSNAEVTAQINRWQSYWKYTPFKQVQFKVNPDGTAEASGILDVNRLEGFITYFGYSTADLQKGLDYINASNMPELPIYIKGTGSVDNNIVNLNFEKVEVYGFTLPADINSAAETGLEAIGGNVLTKVEGLDVEKIEAKNGEAYFKGTVPETTKSKAE